MVQLMKQPKHGVTVSTVCCIQPLPGIFPTVHWNFITAASSSSPSREAFSKFKISENSQPVRKYKNPLPLIPPQMLMLKLMD